MRQLLFLYLFLSLPVLAQTPDDLRSLMQERAKIQGESRLDSIEALLEKNPKLLQTPILRLNGPGELLPLHEAIFVGDVELVGLFIEHGADLNAPSGKRKMRPLSWAMNDLIEEKKTMTLVGMLLENGADPNLGDKLGNSAVHRWAARRALRRESIYPDMLDALLRSGANASATNNSGLTPLMIAVTNHNAPAVKLLLAAGVDPVQKTRFGTAVELAEEQAERSSADPEAAEVLKLLKKSRPASAPGALDFEPVRFQDFLDFIAVVSLNFDSIALDGASGSAASLNLLENGGEIGFRHPGLENDHHILAPTPLPPHLDVSGTAGQRHLFLVAHAREVLALGAPVRVG